MLYVRSAVNHQFALTQYALYLCHAMLKSAQFCYCHLSYSGYKQKQTNKDENVTFTEL